MILIGTYIGVDGDMYYKVEDDEIWENTPGFFTMSDLIPHCFKYKDTLNSSDILSKTTFSLTRIGQNPKARINIFGKYKDIDELLNDYIEYTI